MILPHKPKRCNPRQPHWAMNRFARSKFNLPRPDSENIAMTTSSTSATAQPRCSPNETSNIALSANDTACPRCGYLTWFTPEELGNTQIVLKPTVRLLETHMVEKLIGLDTLFRASDLCLISVRSTSYRVPHWASWSG